MTSSTDHSLGSDFSFSFFSMRLFCIDDAVRGGCDRAEVDTGALEEETLLCLDSTPVGLGLGLGLAEVH